MTDLDKEIAALESEIEEYKVDLKNAKTFEERKMYAGLVMSRADTLNELMKQQREATKGMW
jgi:hypothetical protein